MAVGMKKSMELTEHQQVCEMSCPPWQEYLSRSGDSPKSCELVRATKQTIDEFTAKSGHGVVLKAGNGL